MTLRIVVHGTPAPQGSKRFVGTSGGKGRMVESSAAVGPWREAIRAETQRAIEAGGATFPTGPVSVNITFYLARPRSHYGARGLRPSAPHRPSTRPDLDKLVRAVLDGLVAGGAIRDDAQISDLAARKRYTDGSGSCCIAVWPSADLLIPLLEEPS